MKNQDETNESKSDPSSTALDHFSDAELLDAWTHDRLADAFAILVKRYSVMVLTVCRRKCRSAADADDAFQTTFLVLAKNSAKIARPECLAGWLHRVAHRAATATLSRKTQNSESTIESVMIDDPLDKIARQHDAIVLDEELAALPEQYRTVLVMQVYEEYPLERMAEHFQTTLGSIRGRLQRGKKLLASRLRRRGVTPVLAFAAAGATTISAGEASAASSSVLSLLAENASPSPPIPEHLLHPLVTSGKRIMTPINALGGLAAAGTIAAMLMIPMPDNGSATADANPPITIQAAPDAMVAQFGGGSSGLGGGGMGGGGMGGNMNTAAAANQPNDSSADGGQTMLQVQYRAATATGPVADALAEILDDPIELQVSGTLQSLVDQLESQLKQPVILNERAISYAELDPSTNLKYTTRQEPLRTALRKLLAPLGLKAVVQSEGLEITADHSQLVHRGIGTDQWLNLNEELMAEADKKLSAPTSHAFVETPISEAIQTISADLELPIVLDRRALEEIGLDSDTPVNCDLKNLPAYDLLSLLLREHDLTLSVSNNLHSVTTVEAAEDSLLSRIYWLEGIGFSGNHDSLMTLIETTVTPDTWEALGGVSTMCPAPGKRPGIVISTTYAVHRRIEMMIDALRKNSFELDAVADEIEIPVPKRPSGVTGFGGGIGGGASMGGTGGGFM